MAIDTNTHEGLLIRKRVPFTTMPSATFRTLCRTMTVEEIRDGALFKRGDSDSSLIYLLSGTVVLGADGLDIETVSADSDAAKFALAHQIPRKIDATAKGTVRIVRLAAETLTHLPPIEYLEDTKPMIDEESDENADDWMTLLLKSPVFQRLPPANLQKFLMGLQSVDYEPGATIIEQGAEGDYYYLLKKGQCLITRKPTANAKEIKLGMLDKGDSFGEDSLLTGAPRNVTITAMTPVSLLRLDKARFVSLIKEPSIKHITAEALDQTSKQGAVLMDIRTPDEFAERHVPGSTNIPSFSLRMQLKTLNRDKLFIIICKDGSASEAAAFLLLKNKYNALVLKGGMQSVPIETGHDEACFEIDDGVETMVDFTPDEGLGIEAEAGLTAEADYSDLEKEVKKLRSDNEALQKAHQSLTEKYRELSLEKAELEKQLKALTH